MIRQAKKEDSQKIWQIRNYPLNRKNSRNQEKIDFGNHDKWFTNKYFKNKNNYCFVLEEGGEVVGYCRFDLGNNNYVISIALDPDYHGKGFGSKLLKESLREIKRIKKDIVILAEVKKENVPSTKLFERCGFCSYREDKKNLYYKHD